jgi:hypothetical protein
MRKGEKVNWNYGKYKAEGIIKEKFTSRIERTFNGSKVTRNASPDEPAYLIVQKDGHQVLKSESELKHGRKLKS